MVDFQAKPNCRSNFHVCLHPCALTPPIYQAIYIFAFSLPEWVAVDKVLNGELAGFSVNDETDENNMFTSRQFINLFTIMGVTRLSCPRKTTCS